MVRAKRKYTKRKPFVEHHISYNPEYTVKVTHGEHHILTRMQWCERGKVSMGFLEALGEFIIRHSRDAVKLGDNSKT